MAIADPSERSSARYATVAIILHWLIAATLLFEIGLGWRMETRGPQSFAVYQLHKSIGITILALTLLRLVWRLINPPPPFPATMKAWERGLAHATHLGFYGLLLGLPLTGWLLVSSSSRLIPTVLYGWMPWPHVPGVATLGAAAKESVNAFAEFGHHALVYLAYALVALHVAGALKHQFLERGGDMARMLPAPRRALGGMTIAVIVALMGMVALGRGIQFEATPSATPAPASPAADIVPAALAPPAPVEAPAPAENAIQAVAEVDAVPAEPVAWTVERGASSLAFATSWSGGPVNGRFDRWTASIDFSPEALDRSSVEVVIDMASAKTGVSETESALPQASWFAAATHPEARYTASSFRHLGGDRYEARGQLSLRGVKRPLALPFTLRIEGRTARMSGTARIDRTLFGVGQGADADGIPPTVSISVKVVATRK